MARAHRKATAAFGSRTDIGCVREHNEDSLAVAPPLYVVCDGMGGHAAGEVASEIAVNVIAQRAPDSPDATALGQAVEEANLAIIESARQGIGRPGMGCTCTAAILENERLVIAQVGDSRAYLFHNGRLQQITRDHSLVADLVEAGEITLAEARVHPRRSVITRALGSDPHTQPDLFEINVQTGDRLLLCSDGLTSMVEDDQVARILASTPDPQLAASKLVNAANAAGGHDNITVIVTNVTGFAEVRRRKIARKTKVTAAMLIVLLLAIFGGAGYALNYWVTHCAYIGEQDGNVAIYQGVPGTIMGLSFSSLHEVTDVSLDDLEKAQPGVVNRIKSEGIRTESLESAQALAKSYQEDIAAHASTASDGAASGSSSAASSSDATTSSSGNATSDANASGSNANTEAGAQGENTQTAEAPENPATAAETPSSTPDNPDVQGEAA